MVKKRKKQLFFKEATTYPDMTLITTRRYDIIIMKTILLVCSAGMSTSLLVTKMEAAAKEAGVECKIFALPFSDAPRVLEEVDCILLGPQVRFQKAAIEKLAAGRKAGPIPVDVIDMRDYGTMNGKAVFESAMKMIG